MKMQNKKGNVLPVVIIFVVVVSIMSIGVFTITLNASKVAITSSQKEFNNYELENKMYDFLNYYLNINDTDRQGGSWYSNGNTFDQTSIEYPEYSLFVEPPLVEGDTEYTIKITNKKQVVAIETKVVFNDTTKLYEIKTWGETEWSS